MSGRAGFGRSLLSYYLSERAGRFGVVAFRGEVKKSYYSHLRRVSEDGDKMIMPIGQRDLLVFIRQSRNGKIKEAHIQDAFDKIQREIG